MSLTEVHCDDVPEKDYLEWQAQTEQPQHKRRRGDNERATPIGAPAVLQFSSKAGGPQQPSIDALTNKVFARMQDSLRQTRCLASFRHTYAKFAGRLLELASVTSSRQFVKKQTLDKHHEARHWVCLS